MPVSDARHHRNDFTGDCPACGYKGAFSVTRIGDRKLYYCHAGCGQNEIHAAITGQEPLSEFIYPIAPKQGNRNTLTYVHCLWRSSLLAQKTLVSAYLLSRAIGGKIPSTLRFLPNHLHKPTVTNWPVMLAAVTDHAGRMQAVHRTYLAQDGKGKAPVTPAKMTLAQVRGFSCHLAPAGTEIVISEGIETGLSVQFATSIPTWAALSAGGMRNLILPALPMASTVTIAADADPTGMKAAYGAAARWRQEGRHVRIAAPPEGTDFNDVLRETTL